MILFRCECTEERWPKR